MLDSLVILGGYDPNLFDTGNYTILKSTSNKYYSVDI